MNFAYSGTTVQNVYYNGNQVNCVYMNGTLVWQRAASRPDTLEYCVVMHPVWDYYIHRSIDECFTTEFCYNVGSCGDSDCFCAALTANNNFTQTFDEKVVACGCSRITIYNKTCNTSCTFTTGMCGDTRTFEGHNFTFDDAGSITAVVYQTNLCMHACSNYSNVCDVNLADGNRFVNGCYDDYLIPACFSRQCISTDVQSVNYYKCAFARSCVDRCLCRALRYIVCIDNTLCTNVIDCSIMFNASNGNCLCWTDSPQDCRGSFTLPKCVSGCIAGITRTFTYTLSNNT